MWTLSLLLALTCSADTTDRRTDELYAAITRYVQPIGLDWSRRTTRIAWIDITRDGREDALVYLSGADWCGSGGCTLLVFEQMDPRDAEEFGRFRPSAEISMVSGPIRVVRSRGYWSDLIVRSPRGWSRLRFDGESYPMSPADGEPVRGQVPRGRVVFGSR